jgi:small redox-active disulfide protein 2
MEVLVLGPGCPNCRKTFERVLEAVQVTGLDADVRKVEDPVAIAEYVMLTPGVVLNGKVRCAGRVPEVEEIAGWLREAASAA